jgi:hypothetical protein
MLSQKKIDLNYIYTFYYEFITITKIDLLKNYKDTTHIDETSLEFGVYYPGNQWNKNNLLIIVFLCKF